MKQRTCNIIMCCKGHCRLPMNNSNGHSKALNAVAAYMSHECGCPADDYRGQLMEKILSEALFDYMDSADKPGSDLRNLFHHYGTEELAMNERIVCLFQIVQVMENMEKNQYVNGFSKSLIEQSRKDLGEV